MDEDYLNFLISVTNSTSDEPKNEDDPEADPEYNFLEDKKLNFLDKEELREDKGVQISRKEVNDLTRELFEFADTNFRKDQKARKKKKATENVNSALDFNSTSGTMLDLVPVLAEPDLPQFVSQQQRDLLRMQLQQNVQILTQFFLMTYKHPEYHGLAKTAKANLDSFKFLNSGADSAFNIENLAEASNTISSWERKFFDPDFREEYVDFVNEEIAIERVHKAAKCSYWPRFHPELKNTMLHSKALAYPHLLPPFLPKVMGKKWKHFPYFPAEENLIVLGLDEFLPLADGISQKKFKRKVDVFADIVKMIKTHLLPARDFNGLLGHIQRCKRDKSDSKNVIKEYFKNGTLPKIVHWIPEKFEIEAPKDWMELLPEQWIISDGYSKRPNLQKLVEKEKFASSIPRNHPLRNPIVNVLVNIPDQATPIKLTFSDDASSPPNLSVSSPEENVGSVKLPQLRKTAQRLAKMKSEKNVKLLMQSPVGFSGAKERGKVKAPKNDEPSSSAKGDDEELIAELMLACTTIKKDTTNRKKAKQARELENIKRLVEAENDANRDERFSKFAASFLQKLHSVIEPNDPETCKSAMKTYLEFCEKIEQVDADDTLGNRNEKQDELAVNLYGEICEKLSSYPELCSDFLLFLTPQQASQAGKSVEHAMLRKMKEFVDVTQVYFAKQPSRLAKIMQAITNLSGDPSITKENVTEHMGPVLKGHPLVLDLFLQVLPSGKPPESLFAPHSFENLVCPVGPHDKNKLYAEDAPELYENIELPVPSSHDDPYGGESCKCECHNSPDSKVKNSSEHCASCGTRFLNGRIYLQTSEGLRPAKITFSGAEDEQLENVARVSLKSTEKPLPAPTKRRKRSSKSESSPTKEPFEDTPGKNKRVASSPPKSEKTPETKKKKIGDFGSPQAGTSRKMESASFPEARENDEGEGERAWTRDEDYLLLKLLKEEYEESTFVKISESLRDRSVRDVKERFGVLYGLMRKYV